MDQNSDKTIQELISDAERLEDEGAISNALEHWRNVLIHERDPVFLCRFGRIAMKAGRLEEARQAFLEAVNLAPRLSYAYECLGMWHDEQGNLEEALDCFRKSVAINETSPAYTLLGASQLRLTRVADAQKSFEKALSLDPFNDEAHYNLGLTFALEQPSKAVLLFRKAIEIDPEFALAHSELGQVLRRIDKNEEAEHHLRKAIELDESDAWAHIYLGNILWLRRELCSAEEFFKKAIDLWSDSSIPYWCLAMLYEYQDRGEEAEKLYQQALAIDPDDPEANKRFGVYLRDIGQAAKAKAYLERALELDPEDRTIGPLLANLT